MKESLIAQLRDKTTSRAEYRNTTEKLGWVLAAEAADLLEQEERIVQTPLAPATGSFVKNSVVLIPILRAGAALLPSFMHFFDQARVGFLGMKRDEETAEADMYYCNLPPVRPDEDVLILEPMIATGGSSCQAIEALIRHGVKEEQILFVSVIAATEGLAHLRNSHPKIRLLVGQEDAELNDVKFIVPGLGDFGDRFFGTDDPT
jgi:uracil phosphoribosyltransferase